MFQRQRWWVIKATDGDIGSFGLVPSGLLLGCMSVAKKEKILPRILKCVITGITVVHASVTVYRGKKGPAQLSQRYHAQIYKFLSSSPSLYLYQTKHLSPLKTTSSNSLWSPLTKCTLWQKPRRIGKANGLSALYGTEKDRKTLTRVVAATIIAQSKLNRQLGRKACLVLPSRAKYPIREEE